MVCFFLPPSAKAAFVRKTRRSADASKNAEKRLRVIKSTSFSLFTIHEKALRVNEKSPSPVAQRQKKWYNQLEYLAKRWTEMAKGWT